MSVVPASFRARVRASIEAPVAGFFGRLGFSPNALTLVGFGIAVIGAYFAATQSWLIAGLIVAFGAIFDLFDGALARATGKASKFGAFLDSSLDRAGEGVVYIGIVVAAVVGGLDRWLAPLAISASVAGYMVSYVRARSESLGFSPGTGMASVGLAPREVRTAILVIGLIATGLLPQTTQLLCLVSCGPNGPMLPLMGALGLITVLSVISALQRILFTYNQSRSQHQEVNH